MIVILHQLSVNQACNGHRELNRVANMNSNLIAYKMLTGNYKVIKNRATGELGIMPPLLFSRILVENTDLPLEVIV
jgi:hypothetical protein